MRNKFVLLITLISIGCFFTAAFGQSPKNSIIAGDVASIDAGKIMLNTKGGAIDVTLSDKTVYKRVPADNPSLKAAVAATFTDIGPGDKLLVSGLISDDKKTLPATTVYLMSKTDIAAAKTKENERWRTRGISGKITAVDLVTKKVTVEIRSLMGSTSVALEPKPDAKYLRYAPNSVKFSEATASSFGDLKVGDMLRAVGDKSADGAGFAAEEILTGAFQTLAGVVKSVDPVKNEIVVTDLQTKKDVTIDLSSASLLKKFPEQMAQMMAARAQGGPPAAGGQGGQGQPPRTGGAGNGQAAEGQGARRSGGIDEMLDRFPTITAADLKVGDMIAVSSTKTEALDHITAIKLLAGVEPFIRAAQATSGGRRQGISTLSIPGLDDAGLQ